MNSYWHPHRKWQFVEWFVAQGLLVRWKAERMTKRELAGKYKEVRAHG